MSGRGGRVWRISEVAELYGVHAQTLRHYEREGLLRPGRTRGNTRLYTERDLETLECILALSRDLGVNRAGIEVILNMRARMAELQAHIARLEEVVNSQVFAGAPASAADGALVRVPRPLVVPSRPRGH